MAYMRLTQSVLYISTCLRNRLVFFFVAYRRCR